MRLKLRHGGAVHGTGTSQLVHGQGHGGLPTACDVIAVQSLSALGHLAPGDVVYNAPRPLLGTRTFEAVALGAGRQYAVTNRADPNFELWDNANKRNDAKVLVELPMEHARRLVQADYDRNYPGVSETELSDAEIWQTVQGNIEQGVFAFDKGSGAWALGEG